MNISGLQYNLNRKTLEIYLSGCDGKCDGCHNKELWDYKLGKNYNYYLKKIAEDVNSGMIDEFWILGGDPMDQEFMELYRGTMPDVVTDNKWILYKFCSKLYLTYQIKLSTYFAVQKNNI